MKKILLVAALSLSASLTGCDTVAQYSGDGRLFDNGPGAETDRYVLDFGEVSLRAPTSTMFKFKNLPRAEFVIGIELRSSSSKIEQGALNSVVAISLREDGKTIINKEARLSDWTWSVHSTGNRAFIYGREQPHTYFTPRDGSNYELTLRIKESDRGKANYAAMLVAKSGGWK